MNGQLMEVELKKIRPNRLNPRLEINIIRLNDLADSIKQVGLLEPLVVRPVGDGYEVVVGERRYRASQQIGLKTVPAVVRKYTDEEVIEFIRNFLCGGLKDTGQYLEKSVITGIMRIARESIFSGLNNPGVFTLLSEEFNDKFGPRIVITFSGLLLCLGYVLMSQVNAVWQIYLFYGLFISLGSCVWVPLVSTSTLH
jgi:hypothetical protein